MRFGFANGSAWQVQDLHERADRRRLTSRSVARLFNGPAQRVEHTAEITTGLISDDWRCAPWRPGFRTVHEPIAAVSRGDAVSLKPIHTARIRVAPELGFTQRQSWGRQ